MLHTTEMSLSASGLFRNGCTQLLGGAHEGSKGSREGGNRNRVVRAGFRCEVRSDVKVEVEEKVCADEKICAVSGKRCVMAQSARKECGGPAEAARCAFNDAMLMCNVAHNIDERARNDFLVLSRCAFPRIMLVSVVAQFCLWNGSSCETG